MNIEDLKNTLENKQQQLLTRIDAIGRDFKKGRSQDFAEQSTETENDEVLDEIKQEAKLELQQVKEALSRIENNRYGRCVKCDEDIAVERLHALPYVTTCIKCAQ